MTRLYLLFVFLALPLSVHADNFDGTIDLFESSPSVKPFFENSYGYAVFPTIGKGGFLVGGAHGKGKVYVNDEVTGTVSMTKLTVGFQWGAQVFSEIIFLQDKRAYEEFTSGTYEFDTSVSAIVITASAQAQAGTSGNTASASAGPSTGVQAETGYNKGMSIFVHAQGGLMYEAAIGGQKFKFESIESIESKGDT